MLTDADARRYAHRHTLQQSAGAEIVKKMFIEIHSYYRRFDLDKNLR
jgi:hypothetical protein